MHDKSHLDQKYFIDNKIYNCPYCNRRNVAYSYSAMHVFDWSNDKECATWYIQCLSCDKKSMHLTYENLQQPYCNSLLFSKDIDIDSKIFYSVPTSFFVIDNRIPKIIRELITEAEGCIKMNFLTGASSCTRKAIYELTILEKAIGDDYESKIKSLKTKYQNIDGELFDILCHIKDMTSNKIHEQSWDKWDGKYLSLFLETLKAILHEIYVIPDERKKRSIAIKEILPSVLADKKEKQSK